MKPKKQKLQASDLPVRPKIIFERAVSSAKKHGLELSPGSPNLADGNCAFESVVININERTCFAEKLPFSADYYRRIWVTDFKNKTVDDPTWNVYSRKDWENGWAEMMQSGVYERGLFGDLMLFAIACGVKKNLLIFNTSLDSPHDPIYVCDPQKFGVQPDTHIPVILAYDMSHYESLNPVSTSDVNRSSELVNEYINGLYTYSRKDLPFLLEPEKRQLHQAGNSDEYENLTKERPAGACMFQDSLPDNLKGKRLKDMTGEEKKEYNNFRKKFSRKNVGLEKSAEIKKKDAEAKTKKRSEETGEEKLARRKKTAMHNASMRAKETEGEKSARKDKKAKQNKIKRALETEEQKSARNEKTAKQNALKRAKETEGAKSARKDKKAKQNASKRSEETEEEKSARIKKAALCNAARRAEETEDEKKERKTKEKQQRMIQRAKKIPSTHYDARNAQKVLCGEQIVPMLEDTEEKLGRMKEGCDFCGAKKWKKETPSLCCNGGKISLDPFPDPPDLLKQLLIEDSENGRLFRKNTRSFNNALTLSSLQVRLKSFDNGFAPSVIFEGKVCQRIGPLYPNEGEDPKFAQLYVVDPASESTKRIQNMTLPDSMTTREINQMKSIMGTLQEMLKECNPFVKDIMHICELPDEEFVEGKLIISCKERPRGEHERKYNIQQSLSEVSVLTNSLPGDMVLHKREGGLQTIYDIHPSSQPLHFILLFPFGTRGYDEQLRHTDKPKRVSPREFFCYHLNMRCLESDFLFRFGRLFQEYICLAFTTMESQRLKYQRNNQNSLRADSYKNVREALNERVPLTDKLTADDHNLKVGLV